MARQNGKAAVMREYRNADFMGTREVAEMLGVEKPRIGRWLKNESKGLAKRLPTPVARLRMSPIWLRDQILALERGDDPANIASPKLSLVGTAEAAEILDMKRDRIGAWQRQGAMPEPAAHPDEGGPGAGPLWWKADVEKLIPERERRRRTQGAAA